MPTFNFTAPDGKKYTVNGPEGATEQQAFQMLQGQMGAPSAPPPAPEKQFGEQMNDFVADVPRVLGRTARMGLQGVGGIADFISSPIRGGLNLLPGVNIQPGSGRILADAVGLPKPRPGMESVADSAGEMIVGGGAMMKGAQKVGQLAQRAVTARAGQISAGTAQTGALATAKAKLASGTVPIAGMMAANPAGQLVSAGAAGGAGGYVRETGGNGTSQFLASLAAGLAAPFAMGKVQQMAGAASNALRPSPVNPTQIDIQINNALQPSGMVLGDLPAAIQTGIRQDVAKAMQGGANLNADAVRRLADYRLVGALPSAAGLTRDPAIFTQQKNLAKLGINSKDEAAQQLGQMANANNSRLITGINELGAGAAGTALSGGQRVINALDARNTRAQSMISQRYNAARATDGRSALLDHETFIANANKLMDDAMVGGKLPSDVRNALSKDWEKVVKNPNADPSAAKPAFGLPVDAAEQIKSNIASLQRATIDGSEKTALGLVRQALDDTPLLSNQLLGRESIDAFNRARSLNRSWMGVVDKTPALKAVRDGIAPDKFVQQFITGAAGKANVADVKALHSSIKSNPDAMQAVKEQIAGHLKGKALNGASDEVGALSQSAYNKALGQIGDEKLRLFFTKSEVDQMKAIGRVASYEQVQPVGSAVNNSNTAGTLMANVLDRIAGSTLISKIPFGNALQQPAQNIITGSQSRAALNVPKSLAALPSAPIRQRQGLLMSPYSLLGLDDE